MNEEDLVALKLKGYNCHVRFIDGEDLYCRADVPSDPAERDYWISDIEQKINGHSSDELNWGEAILPLPDIAIKTDSIKYVKIF